AKGKAKSNKKGAGGTDNPVATWDVRKAKLSTLEKLPFPVVHRGETRRLFETALLAKAGAYAKLEVQLKGHEASKKAMDELTSAKDAMELAWQADSP
ncbi:unnamed protein product, partial [Symbiodinium natans]